MCMKYMPDIPIGVKGISVVNTCLYLLYLDEAPEYEGLYYRFLYLWDQRLLIYIYISCDDEHGRELL